MAIPAVLLAAIIGTAAAGTTGIVDTIVDAVGRHQTNQLNKEMFEKEMAFNSAEAQKNRDFQLMMSNTAHQRQVADMKAAGLNPWLSVGGGQGAWTGTGSSSSAKGANMQNPAPDMSSLVHALSSVKDIAMIDLLSQKYRGKSISGSGSYKAEKTYKADDPDNPFDWESMLL